MNESQDLETNKICSKVEPAFELLSRKWIGLIINTLLSGEKHFCDLERALPNLSSRVLSVRMKELEEAGLLTRTVNLGPPVRVTYCLTQKGLDLQPVMDAIKMWAYSYD